MTTQRDATVLIVDDEADIVELYEAFLSSRYDIRTATSGAAALETVDDSVDVVLLDRRMPEMSGDEVLSRLRDRGLNCQVAMLTGVKPAENIIEMPFDDYKVKPVGRGELITLVEVLLERAKYDEKSQQFFRYAAKKAALEFAEKTDTDAYREIVERMEVLREEINGSLDDASNLAIGDKAPS